MSITVFVKTKAGVHDVEVDGTETMGSLYKKAACAAGLLEGRFKLVWEDNVLSRFGDGEVQGIGLVEGAVVDVVPGTIVGLTELKEGSEMKLELERLVAADPELVLEVDVGDSADTVVVLGEQDLPSGLRGLVVTDSTNRTRDIGDRFLGGCDLTSVDLKLAINTIGSYFFERSSLSYINFEESFTNVTSIGHRFMFQCSEVQSLDLSGLTNVKFIGSSFLAECSRLQSVDLSGLVGITAIGDQFMFHCSGLQSVDLSSFTSTTSIGHSFLSRCSGLQSVDLSSFTNVTSIGNFFLSSCSGLRHVDLSVIAKVASVGHSFMRGCTSLQNVDLSVVANITTIGDHLLGQCGAARRRTERQHVTPTG